MNNDIKIINESIQFLFESELNTSQAEYVIFFARPFIKKGLKEIKTILKNGGKDSANLCKSGFKRTMVDIYFILNEILVDEKFHMFIKTQNLQRDLPKDVLKTIFIYVKNEKKLRESGEEVQLTEEEKNAIFNELNPNYIQLLFKTIVKFKIHVTGGTKRRKRVRKV